MANEVSFLMMLVELIVVAVVDVPEVVTIKVANLTLEVRTHLHVDLEGVKVVKASAAKVTVRMIKDYFSSFTQLSFLEVTLKFKVGIQLLFSNHALAVVEAYVAR